MKILFIGLGSIGQRHLRNLLATGQKFEFHAYRKRGLPLPKEFEAISVITHTELFEAISVQPDITFLCAPPMLQTEVLPRIIQDTKSHLFIEKPIAVSTEGMEALCTLMEAQNRVSLIGYNLRFHPVHQLVANALQNNVIGNVISARASVGQYLPEWHPAEDYRQGYSANNSLGGGAVLDLIHEIDLLYSWFGNADTVKAITAKRSHLEMDVEDTAEILLRFNIGVIGSIHVDYVQRAPFRNGMIIGDEGTILYDLLKNRFELLLPGKEPQVQQLEGFVRNDMYLNEIKALLAAIENKTTCVPDLRNGMEVLDIALKAKEDGVN
jgi:predicted dehydrogenase